MKSSQRPPSRTVVNLLFTGLCLCIFVLMNLGKPVEKTQVFQLESNSVFGLLKDLVQAPAQVESYYAGHFGQREVLISGLYDLRLRVFGDRVFHDVLIGEDGWLYYTGENNLDDYQRSNPFTEAQLAQYYQGIKAVQDTLSAQGMQFLFVIAPNKESMYPEYLSNQIQQTANPARLDQLVDYFQRQGGLEIVDLRPVLLDAKLTNQVYLRTDTHWNELGAYLAYQTIMKRIALHFPGTAPVGLDRFEIRPERIRGDLSLLLPLSQPYWEESIQLIPKKSRRQIFVTDDPYGLTITEIPDADLPKVVVFRDSFFNALLPFFSEDFSRAVYQRSFSIDYNLIMAEQADVVVLEVAERYLGVLLEGLVR